MAQDSGFKSKVEGYILRLELLGHVGCRDSTQGQRAPV